MTQELKGSEVPTGGCTSLLVVKHCGIRFPWDCVVRPHRVAAVPPLDGAASLMKGNTTQNGRWERGEEGKHHPKRSRV